MSPKHRDTCLNGRQAPSYSRSGIISSTTYNLRHHFSLRAPLILCTALSSWWYAGRKLVKMPRGLRSTARLMLLYFSNDTWVSSSLTSVLCFLMHFMWFCFPADGKSNSSLVYRRQNQSPPGKNGSSKTFIMSKNTVKYPLYVAANRKSNIKQSS